MADDFTANLRLRKPEVGAHDDDWADELNSVITAADSAVAAAASVSVTAGNVTLTEEDGIDDQARRMFIYATGTQTVTTRTVTVPDTPKVYVLINDSARVVTFQRASGGATLAVRPGQTALVSVTSTGIEEVPPLGSVVDDTANVSTLTLDISGTHGAGDATCSAEYIVQGSWVFMNIEDFSALNFSSNSFGLRPTGAANWPAAMVPAVGRSIPCLILENSTLVPAYFIVGSVAAAVWGIVRVDGDPWLDGGTDDRTLQHKLSFTYPLRANG